MLVVTWVSLLRPSPLLFFNYKPCGVYETLSLLKLRHYRITSTVEALFLVQNFVLVLIYFAFFSPLELDISSLNGAGFKNTYDCYLRHFDISAIWSLSFFSVFPHWLHDAIQTVCIWFDFRFRGNALLSDAYVGCGAGKACSIQPSYRSYFDHPSPLHVKLPLLLLLLIVSLPLPCIFSLNSLPPSLYASDTPLAIYIVPCGSRRMRTCVSVCRCEIYFWIQRHGADISGRSNQIYTACTVYWLYSKLVELFFFFFDRLFRRPSVQCRRLTATYPFTARKRAREIDS